MVCLAHAYHWAPPCLAQAVQADFCSVGIRELSARNRWYRGRRSVQYQPIQKQNQRIHSPPPPRVCSLLSSLRETYRKLRLNPIIMYVIRHVQNLRIVIILIRRTLRIRTRCHGDRELPPGLQRPQGLWLRYLRSEERFWSENGGAAERQRDSPSCEAARCTSNGTPSRERGHVEGVAVLFTRKRQNSKSACSNYLSG